MTETFSANVAMLWATDRWMFGAFGALIAFDLCVVWVLARAGMFRRNSIFGPKGLKPDTCDCGSTDVIARKWNGSQINQCQSCREMWQSPID